MRRIFTVGFALIIPLLASAQLDKIYTERGNKALEKKDLDAAIEAYQKALEVNPDFKEAAFNLGNAYLSQARERLAQVDPKSPEAQKVAEEVKAITGKAARQYGDVAKRSETPAEINKAQYNLGNAELLGGQLEKSIEAYKEALRKIPTDEDARYNLAFAQQMKKQQEQQQDEEKEEQEEKQDENQEKKQDEQKKDQQDQQQDKQEQPQQLSKEEAEKMLEALAKQEKDLQDKIKRDNKKVQRIKIEKDW